MSVKCEFCGKRITAREGIFARITDALTLRFCDFDQCFFIFVAEQQVQGDEEWLDAGIGGQNDEPERARFPTVTLPRIPGRKVKR
jgi:hypothetical protein